MAKKKVDSIQVSDIVSVSTMLKIASIIRIKAADIARRKKAPLKSDHVPGQRTGAGGDLYHPRNIGIKTPKTTQNQIIIELTLSDIAMAFETGEMNPHPITAKNVPMLRFPNDDGGWTVVKSVNHKGFTNLVGGRPFLKPAKEQTAKERRELLEKEVGKNVRTIISGMVRVVK